MRRARLHRARYEVSSGFRSNRKEIIVVTRSSDVDEIYSRMAVIRRDPHANVSESVAGTEAVVDWGGTPGCILGWHWARRL